MSCRDLETSVTEYFFHKKALEKLHCKVFVSMFKKIVPDNPCPHRTSKVSAQKKKRHKKLCLTILARIA
jgi:hypothetical protein